MSQRGLGGQEELPSEGAAGEARAVRAPALPVAVGCAGIQGVPSLEGMGTGPVWVAAARLFPSSL